MIKKIAIILLSIFLSSCQIGIPLEDNGIPFKEGVYIYNNKVNEELYIYYTSPVAIKGIGSKDKEYSSSALKNAQTVYSFYKVREYLSYTDIKPLWITKNGERRVE